MTRLPNKFVIEQQFHRKLSFTERLRILVGWNLQVDATVLVHMKKGALVKCPVRLTKQASGEDQMRDNALTEAEFAKD